MLSSTKPVDIAITARLGANPRYAGSIHDDASARRFGYRAALVPGAFIYGYMSRIALEHWGREWLMRGTIRSHSRRPVFDGETVTLAVSALREDADGQSADIVVRNPAGEEVASGGIGFPARAPAPPDLADFPILPVPEDPPVVTPGGLADGTPLCSVNDVMQPEPHSVSLRDFGEVWPGYAAENIVHPGLLLRLSLRDAIESFRYPTPGIYVSAATQHFGIAHVGDRLATAGRITRTYEKKGNHYFDSVQLLTANGTNPIALLHRSSVYAARQRAAAA